MIARFFVFLDTGRMLLAISMLCTMLQPRNVDAAEAIAIDASSVPTIKSLHLGFKNQYKVGYWTPLQIEFLAGQGEFRGSIRLRTVDDNDLPVEQTVSPLDIGGSNKGSIQTVIKPGRPRSAITVELLDAQQQVVASRTFSGDEIPLAKPTSQEMILEVGESIGFSSLLVLSKVPEADRPVVIQIASPSALPTAESAYAGIDRIVVSTSDEQALLSWSEAQATALYRWVQLGGKLVLCVGKNGKTVLADTAPLARFAPGGFLRVVQRPPNAWESLAGALAEPMVGAGGAKPPPINSTVLSNVIGRIEATDGNLPMVIRSARGFGEVLFIAADLDQPPFADWPARGRLLMRILAADSSLEAGSNQSSSLGMRLGYTDLAGQLRSALDQFEHVSVIPFWLVVMLGLGYVLLLFPIEYWLTSRARKYVEIAWITVPLILIGSCALFYWIGQQHKGNELRASAIDLVDVDLVSGTCRGNSWMNLFSPNTDRYTIHSKPNVETPDGNQSVSWFGLPGVGLGGMNSTLAAPAQFSDAYQMSTSGNQLQHVPLATWSSKSFCASWSYDLENLNTGPEFTLTEWSSDRAPAGTLVNRTGHKLTNAVLMYNGWAYMLGEIEPDQTIQVEQFRSIMNLESYLTQRKVTVNKEEGTPYDAAGTDPSRVLQMIQFYRAAGDREYTGLANRYLSTLDMSDQLAQHRAVLVASGPAATKLTAQGSEEQTLHVGQHAAIYRFVLQVLRVPPSGFVSQPLELRIAPQQQAVSGSLLESSP
ncbi:MAG: hypothetical protein SGJ20_09665 [Planctomycetota bacterium]|nr:hypothetical protein [Planctomycetota bacterium]